MAHVSKLGISLIVLMMGCVSLSNVASASSASPGSIDIINPLAQGPVIFTHTGARTARPACATLDRWAIDTSTNAGQALVASLLIAYAMSKQIIVNGTGACSAWGDTETVSNFAIIN